MNERHSADFLKKKIEKAAYTCRLTLYMAEVQPQDDGSFLLIEKHCPICVAAVVCTGLCGKELEVFQAVLGKDVVIERTEHIVISARRCVYRVSSRTGKKVRTSPGTKQRPKLEGAEE